jgi:uncharacterized protein YbbC (DUF1343 family)
VLTDRNVLDSPQLGIELASALYKLYPQQWQLDKISDLLMNQDALTALKLNVDPHRVAEQYREELEQFKKVRAKYLLY